MDNAHFKQKALILAHQIYPNLDGDELIAEANRIFSYLCSNKYQNFIGLNMISDDILSFAEMLSTQTNHNTLEPLELRDFQRSLLSSWQAGNDQVILHARGVGLTLTLCIYALWIASFRNNVHMGFIVGNPSRMKPLIHQIIAFHTNSAFSLPSIQFYTGSSITFSNGNKIKFLSPSTMVVGSSLSHVLADDAANISFADDDNFYSTIMLANRGQLIVSGTPGMNIGIFYELTNSAILNVSPVKIPWSENPEYTQVWAKKMRGDLGSEAFENQYECQFRSSRY